MGDSKKRAAVAIKASEKRILLKNGFIIDGTKRPGYTGDLLIEGEKVKEISPLTNLL